MEAIQILIAETNQRILEVDQEIKKLIEKRKTANTLEQFKIDLDIIELRASSDGCCDITEGLNLLL